MPTFLEKLSKSALKKLIQMAIDKVFNKSDREEEGHASNKESADSKESSDVAELGNSNKSHPWRLCPVGEHWVVEHALTIPSSARGPEYKTLRRGHCRQNPGKHEFYTAEEFKEIARLHFESLRNNPEAMPTPDDLGYPNGNDYDLSIAGWTKFWNETLKPETPLDPDFLKVLISTESGFRQVSYKSSKSGKARGLVQITESTRKILQDPEGELKDHLISLSTDESRETEPNIAAGTRWLFYKKQLLEKKTGRKVSWEEASADYKGIYSQLGKAETSDRIMNDIRSRHEHLKKQRNDKKKDSK